jgi:(1->4)-alpha-D-glucan 1-alpha-D-glucosylmutase
VTRLALAALTADEPGHDLSEDDVRRALTELTVSLDVYRTYLDRGPPSRPDAATMARAVERCKSGSRGSEVERAVTKLAGKLLERRGTESELGWLDVARRWQQLTGAVMAKGVEDTATYRYNGLLSHAEVGCDPDQASCGIDEFHRFVRRRARTSAGEGLNLTSSHDSKRNEDARCRLAVLSEASSGWGRLVRHWHTRALSAAPRPQPHDELMAYQSLLALWPVDGTGLPRQDLRRVQDYALKGAREAKQHTSWTEPNGAYERTLRSFIARLCREEPFREEMSRFVRAIAPAAASNSLSLTVLKACCPGTPDFFQGTELFEATLTDPDNRRSIDFAAREALLASLPALQAEDDLDAEVMRMLTDWPNGRLKLYVIRALLHLRRRLPDVFASGSYTPLATSGPGAENLVAFSRRRGRQSVITMIPRQTLSQAGRGRFPTGSRVWAATTCQLPKAAPRSYVDIFTGRGVTAERGRLSVATALAVLPVAVLHGSA